jgi:glycogen debranching enzyme
MAYLKFDLIAGEGKQDKNRTLQYISEILLKHAHHVSHDNWRGLPELTNSSKSFLLHTQRMLS